MKEEDFMREAIKDAKKNKHHFGAVIVKDGKIISKTGKRPYGDPRFHAETQAILKATKKLKSKHLKGCTLYSTCEPCPMCFYMAWITHVSKIVYGATLQDTFKYGFEEIDVGTDELNKKGGNRIRIKKGFMRDECLELFK
ncbi:MAG: nucleoside deaminase [Nanoarchaeota archaeon]|nr:nucleoside deaminase [Nanoarchaeota archaeon]